MATAEILGYDSEAFAEIEYKSLDCAKNVDLNRIGKGLDHLEGKLLELRKNDSFYYIESFLFLVNAETYKESTCFGVVVDNNFKQFSKKLKFIFRLLKQLKYR